MVTTCQTLHTSFREWVTSSISDNCLKLHNYAVIQIDSVPLGPQISVWQSLQPRYPRFMDGLSSSKRNCLRRDAKETSLWTADCSSYRELEIEDVSEVELLSVEDEKCAGLRAEYVFVVLRMMPMATWGHSQEVKELDDDCDRILEPEPRLIRLSGKMHGRPDGGWRMWVGWIGSKSGRAEATSARRENPSWLELLCGMMQ